MVTEDSAPQLRGPVGQTRETDTEPPNTVNQSSHPETGDIGSGAQSMRAIFVSTAATMRQCLYSSRVQAWYRKPMVQTVMIAIVFFLTVGMYNAICSLGGGGQSDSDLFNVANIYLFVAFAIGSVASGPAFNKLGLKCMLFLGGIGYAMYAAAFWCYSHTEDAAFVKFAAAMCGLSAACLWASGPTIVMAYPTEDKKGRYIGYFWAI